MIGAMGEFADVMLSLLKWASQKSMRRVFVDILYDPGLLLPPPPPPWYGPPSPPWTLWLLWSCCAGSFLPHAVLVILRRPPPPLLWSLCFCWSCPCGSAPAFCGPCGCCGSPPCVRGNLCVTVLSTVQTVRRSGVSFLHSGTDPTLEP